MERKNLKPRFFVLGTQKAGTTALHQWLIRQPEICLPLLKETHFFSDSTLFKKGFGWYRSQFACRDSTTVLGEVDPDYMYSGRAPERIAAFVRQPNLIFIFREPITRAHSQYLMSRRRGYEVLSFHEALQTEDRRLQEDKTGHAAAHLGYLSRSRYCGQVSRFTSAMPDANVLFIKFDDLIDPTRSGAILSRICTFIGIDQLGSASVSIDQHNTRSEPRWNFLRDALYRESWIKRIGRKVIRSEQLRRRLWFHIDRFAFRKTPDSQQDDSVPIPTHIVDSALDEVRQLEALTGLHLADWYESLERRRQTAC